MHRSRCAISLLLLLATPASRAAQSKLPSGAADGEASCSADYAAQRYRESAQCFQQAAAATKDAAAATKALTSEARALIHLQDLAGANSVLQQALQKSPDNARALYLMGYLLQRLNQPRASLQSFTRAAALERPSAEALRQVALDYVLLQDYPDAEHWLQRAVAEEPKDAEAWYDLGRVHMHGGRFADAQSDLQHSLSLRPDSAKAEDNLGVCLEAQNQIDAALAAYARAVKIADAEKQPSELPYIDYSKLLIERNSAATALLLLKRAVVLNPRSAEAFAQLSRAASAIGDRAGALQAMQKAVALDASNPRLHFQLARLYRSAGETVKADEEAQKSSDLYGKTSHE